MRYLLCLLLAIAPGCTTVYVISGEGNTMERSHEQGDVDVLRRRDIVVKDSVQTPEHQPKPTEKP